MPVGTCDNDAHYKCCVTWLARRSLHHGFLEMLLGIQCAKLCRLKANKLRLFYCKQLEACKQVSQSNKHNIASQDDCNVDGTRASTTDVAVPHLNRILHIVLREFWFVYYHVLQGVSSNCSIYHSIIQLLGTLQETKANVAHKRSCYQGNNHASARQHPEYSPGTDSSIRSCYQRITRAERLVISTSKP